MIPTMKTSGGGGSNGDDAVRNLGKRKRQRQRRRPQQPYHPRPRPTTITPTIIILALLNLILLFDQQQQTLSFFAAAQSIQGYIYWDQNGNGLLEKQPNSELDNGVIDVMVEVRPCGGGGEEENNNAIVAKAMTLWPPTRPDAREEGHSAIYPYGGYYKLNVGSGGNKGCLLTSNQMSILQNQNGISAEASEEVMSGGCYLTVIAPTDYEITSSFPVVAGVDVINMNNNDGTDESSAKMSDSFTWIPHDDNQRGIRYANGKDGSVMVNRGYRARTSRCFGYASSDRNWYSWDSDSSVNNNVGNALQKISLPNAVQYGYDAYLAPQQAYDQTLSMTPAGIVQSPWPLPLRVSSTLALGLEFATNADVEDNTVLLVDSSGKELDGSKSRFEFRPTSASQALSIGTYLSEEAMKDSIQSYTDEYGGQEQGQSNNTSTNYRHANVHGILTDTRVLDEVLQTFLGEKLLEQPPLGSAGVRAEGQEMEFVNVVIANQWSLVEVVDRDVNGSPSKLERRRSHTESDRIAGVTGGRLLCGGSMLSSSTSTFSEPVSIAPIIHTSSLSVSDLKRNGGNDYNDRNHRLLRGSATDRIQSQKQSRQNQYLRQRQPSMSSESSSFSRELVAIPQPHLIFLLHIYGKYDESALLPLDDSNESDVLRIAEDAAAQTSANFAPTLSDAVNGYRGELVTKMRQRSGYGQECNPTTATGSSSSGASALPAGFTPISIQNENGLTGEEYTEIEIGVVNRFDCDKLLPLYYYELSTLAVRTMDIESGSDGGMGGGAEKAVLSDAISSLKVDDGIYGLPTSSSEQTDNTGGSSNEGGGMSTWLGVTIAFVCAIAILAVAAGLYIKRERKKLKEEKERRRKAKEAKMAKKEGKKGKKKVGNEIDNDSLDDDDDDVNGTVKSRKKMDSTDRKRSVGYDSDDSELNRMFDEVGAAGGGGGQDEEPSLAGERSTISSSHRTGAESKAGSKTRKPAKTKKRRRKKKGTTSETDSNHTASNASGLNYSHASGTLGTGGASRDNLSTTVESTLRSKGKEEGDDEEPGQSDIDEEDKEKAPPSKINLSKRDKMEKGISDLSVRLTASLRRSANHTTLENVEESEINKKASKRKSKKMAVRGGPREENGDAETAEQQRRKRRSKLEKIATSFRASIKLGDDMKLGDESDDEGDAVGTPAGNDKGKNKPKKNVRIAPAVPPRRGLSKAMSSMRMSVRKNLIGELSSSSDSSSSSSDDDSNDSSSDSDSDDSSSSSDDSSAKRATKKRQQHQRAEAGPGGGGAQQHRRRSHHKHGPNNGFQQQPQEVHKDYEAQLDAMNLSRRDGSDHRLGEANPELHESELTQTNNYLPKHSRDAPPVTPLRPNLASKRTGSSRSMGSKKGSNRSMGSKSKSSKSSGDFNASHPSMKQGSSRAGSDFNASHPSIHTKSSRGSRRASTGAVRKESKDGHDVKAERSHNGSSKRKTKSRRQTTESHNLQNHQGHHHRRQSTKKDSSGRPGLGRRKPSLAKLRNSLTSSMSSIKRGKSISDLAAEAIEELSDHGDDRADRKERQSERGSRRSGDRRSRAGSNRGLGDDKAGERKRRQSSSKHKSRPSTSNGKKRSSKHKSREGHDSHAAEGKTSGKKSKRKPAREEAEA